MLQVEIKGLKAEGQDMRFQVNELSQLLEEKEIEMQELNDHCLSLEDELAKA